MGAYTFKNGQWLDKKTGEPVTLPDKTDSWMSGGSFYITPDYAGYTCPVTNKWIEGRAAHRENLKRHGCRVLEKGETREAEKTRQRELDRACERVAHEMVSKYVNHF